MISRALRLLPLLFIGALAPAVLAQSADLRVSLTMPPTAFYNGSYAMAFGTMTITNAGYVPAQDLILDFGGGLNPGTWPYPGMKCNSGAQGAVRCTAPSLVPGTTSVAVVGLWDDVPVAGTVETASVTASSATTPDPDFTNNTASANTTVRWQSDMTFDSLNVPSAVGSGETAAITANFSNHGPTPAADPLITISIPPGTRYEGYLAESLFHCAEPPLGGHGDLVCTSSYDYPVRNDFVQALVSVDPSLAPGSVLTLNATLTSTSALKSPLTASGTLTVIAPTSSDAAVSVAATLDEPSVVAGMSSWETYTVSNAGPRDAEIVTLDIRPPGGSASWVGHPTIGSCSGYGPIHCVVATLAPGATMTVMVPVDTYATGTFTSTAVVTWLHGGTAVASNAVVVTSGEPARRRAARH